MGERVGQSVDACRAMIACRNAFVGKQGPVCSAEMANPTGAMLTLENA